MGTESDTDQILQTRKRRAVRSFERGKKRKKKKHLFIYRQNICTHFLKLCCRPCGNSLTQMLSFCAPPPISLPGLPVMGIRMAIGRLRIGKVSLACRKTRPYSTAARRHTKDGTIKDLVLSSALCNPTFQHSASVHNSKKLVRARGVEGWWGRGRGRTKRRWPTLACVKRRTSCRTWPFIKILLSDNGDSCSDCRLKCVRAKVQRLGRTHEFNERKCACYSI